MITTRKKCQPSHLCNQAQKINIKLQGVPQLVVQFSFACQSVKTDQIFPFLTFSNWPGHEFSKIYHDIMFLMILGKVFSEWELFKIISKKGFYQ
jgi:hypothetical protein